MVCNDPVAWHCHRSTDAWLCWLQDTQQLQLQLSIFHGIQMAVSTQAVAAVHSGYLDWQARYKRVLELISGQELGLADAILTASELPDSKATVKVQMRTCHAADQVLDVIPLRNYH